MWNGPGCESKLCKNICREDFEFHWLFMNRDHGKETMHTYFFFKKKSISMKLVHHSINSKATVTRYFPFRKRWSRWWRGLSIACRQRLNRATATYRRACCVRPRTWWTRRRYGRNIDWFALRDMSMVSGRDCSQCILASFWSMISYEKGRKVAFEFHRWFMNMMVR